VQTMFRTSASISSDKFILLVMENLWGATTEDLAKFVDDRSGRLPKPAPGMESIPEGERYWSGLHRVLHNYLARTQETNKLAESYQRQFAERLERYPVGEWATVRIFEFLKHDMAEAAIVSLIGPSLFDLTPNFLQYFWEFDEVAASLIWGLPRWMNREAWNRRDRLRAACAKYLQTALADFDWHGPDADSDWEPVFGSRFSRELAKWMKESQFSSETSAGVVAITGIFG
jgi:hypothetical protein